MNVLGHMLNRGAEENQFGYHHRCSRLRLTHLCFADDLLLFAEGSPRSVAGVLSILDQFKQMSGLAINIQKTSLFHSDLKSTNLGKATYKIHAQEHLSYRYREGIRELKVLLNTGSKVVGLARGTAFHPALRGMSDS